MVSHSEPGEHAPFCGVLGPAQKGQRPISCSSQATDGQTVETQQPPATGAPASFNIVATESGSNFVQNFIFQLYGYAIIHWQGGIRPDQQSLSRRDACDRTQTRTRDTRQKLKQISPSSSPSYCLDQAELMGGGRQTNSRAGGR